MSNDNAITGAFYVSSYAAMPPGVTTAGIRVTADTSQIPTSIKEAILVIRLRLADESVVYGLSATSGGLTNDTYAIYQPEFPLNSGESYMADAIWVESGANPNSIDWGAAVGNTPILGAIPSIKSATFDGTEVNAQLEISPTGVGLGALVSLYSLSGGVQVLIGSTYVESNVASFSITTSGFPEVYSLAVQAAISVVNGEGTGSFSSPYSVGAQSQLWGIPQVAKTITVAQNNGSNLYLTWDLDNTTGCADPDSSIVEVLAGGKIIASATGGTESANFLVNLENESAVTVNISTVTNGIASKALSTPIINDTPEITDVVANVTKAEVTANISNATNATGAMAFLTNGSTIVSGPVVVAAGVATFSYQAENIVGLGAIASGTNGVLTGPDSGPACLLATAPNLASAQIQYSATADTWDIVVNWDRLPDVDCVKSYTVAIMQDGSDVAATETTSGLTHTFSISKAKIDSSKPQTITLSATGMSGGESPTQSFNISFAPALLTGVMVSEEQITANWTAPANIPANNTLQVSYQMKITDSSGNVLYTGPSTQGLAGAVSLNELSLIGITDPQILINTIVGDTILIADNALGSQTYATLITESPAFDSVTVNPTDNKSIMTWKTVTSTVTTITYDVNYTTGSPSTGISGTSNTLATALTAGQQLGYNVQALGTSNGVAVTGPSSVWLMLPSVAANVSSIRFNGSTVDLSWNAQSDAQTYLVNVYDNAATPANVFSGSTAETSLSFTVSSLTASNIYTAYVQPLNSVGAGLAGKSMELFESALFTSLEPATTSVPYVYPGVTMNMLGSDTTNPTETALVLYLPELGLATGALGSKEIEVGPFKIEPSEEESFPYKLTIAADDTVWKFDTTEEIRTTLQTNYVDFLKAVETPEDLGAGVTGASPNGLSILQAAIGRYMPQTYEELMYYNFGFSTDSSVGKAYVDLRPGMILRASISDYQEISGNGIEAYVQGYAGSTDLDFEIGGYTTGANSANPNWMVGFDNFLSTLAANNALEIGAPYISGTKQAGAAGDVDLYYTGFIQPFYRLFIPALVQSATDPGSSTTTSNFMILAAATYTSQQDIGVVNPTTDYAAAYFRARTILKAMIRVSVNGTSQVVPIGTTVGNILDQMAQHPIGTSNSLNSLRVYRSLGPVVTDPTASSSVGAVTEIRFDWDGFNFYADGVGLDGVSMPLLPGDQVIIA